MRLLIFILLGVGIAYVVGRIISARKEAEDKARRAREQTLGGANVTNDITRVGKGGVLKLPPFGRIKAPIETYVTRRHRYQEEGEPPWHELVCEHGRRELLVEWERKGGETFVTAGFEDENPSLADLGLTEDDLIRFDEERRGTFRWDDSEWTLTDVGERFYYADEGRDREGFYCWELTDAGRTRFISIEKWAGDPDFEVYHLWLVDARAIEVYDAGEARA